jgi:hypothetical protein
MAKPRIQAKPKTKAAKPARRATERHIDLIPGTNVDEYVAPWVLAYLLIPGVGLLTHYFWGHGLWQWVMPPLLAAGGAALAAVAWHDAAARKPLIRIRVSVSALLALVSVAVSTVTGVVTVDLEQDLLVVDWVRPWMDIQMVVGGLLALSWNILRTDAVRGMGDDDRPATKASGYDDLVGLPGSSVSDVAHDGPRTTATIHTAGTQDTDDVQHAGRAIRALAKATSVTVVPHPSGDPTRARVTLLRKDVLRRGVPWPGASRPGGSITDPIRTGVVENGTESLLWLAGDGQGRAPFLGGIAGMPGAGKSRFAWTVWADGASRTDVVWWISDTAKSGQTSGPARDLFDWVAPTAAETQAMLAAVEAAAKWRATYLGDAQEWTPASGIPCLIVWFEEAARVADRFAERIIRLSELVRSTGIIVIFSMQRLSATNMPSDARHNLSAGVCFGTGDAISASFVLSDGTLDAGADPHRWKANRPGYHYLEAPGVPEEEWPLKRRTYLISPEDLTRAVSDGARFRPSGLDAGTAEAAGAAYASRDGAASRPPVPPSRLAVPSGRPGSVPDASQPPRPTVSSRPATETGLDLTETDTTTDPETDADLETALLEEDMDMARDALDPIPDDLAADAAAGPPRPGEYPPGEDFDLGVTPDPPIGARLTVAEQATHVQSMISDLMGDATGLDIDTADLVDAWEALRTQVPGIPTRPALYRWLERYMAAGLAEDRGRGRWYLHRAAASTTVTITDRDEEGGDDGQLSTIAV